MMDDRATDGTARALLDETWAIASSHPIVARQLGRGLERMPDIGLEATSRRSRAGRDIVERIDALNIDALPTDLAVALAAARSLAVGWSREEEWYWLAFDPLGEGFFSMFAPSAYSGGFLLNSVHEELENMTLADTAEAERYEGTVGEYARLVRQLTERTAGQAERGIHMPALHLLNAVTLVTGLRSSALDALRGVIERAGATVSPDLLARIHNLIAVEVAAAFDELLGLLDSDDYRSKAPDTVGLGAYPGGAEIYDDLIRHHTTLDLTAIEVHDRGHARMSRIEEEMVALIAEVGFDGSPADYLASLDDDPAWRADSDEGVAEHFQRYIDRFAPEVHRHFGIQPQAGYSVAPLPAALSGSMTFGYYSPPQPDRDLGLYIFNGTNLARSALPMIAALTYHELVPGHHFHLALQHETEYAHPLRGHTSVTAFAEGWAEYAARFVGEIGMYREPQERFGRLMMEAFLTSRLVVDTGMNAFGWSLERARQYMREHSFMGETEIDSETLRYSCDIPAQALAYKMGDDFLHDLREDLRVALGERFAVADFHDSVLRMAGLPLPIVAAQVRKDLL